MLLRANLVDSEAMSVSTMRPLAASRFVRFVLSISALKLSLLDSVPFCARDVATLVIAVVASVTVIAARFAAAVMVATFVARSDCVMVWLCAPSSEMLTVSVPPPNRSTPLNSPATVLVSCAFRAVNSEL